MPNRWIQCIFWLIGTLAFVNYHPAQAQDNLQITSPVSGIKTTPGQTLAVTVTRSSTDIKAVMLVGDLLSNSNGFSEVKTGPDPLVFQITIPSDKPPGRYRFGAIDVTRRLSESAPVVSDPIDVIVDLDSLVSSITAAPSSIALDFVGDEETIRAFAQLPNNTSYSIANADDVLYTSLDQAIARIVGYGRVIGTGPGNTKIMVQYKNQQTTVDVSVPSLIAGDLNGDDQVDLDDLTILRTRLNTPANDPNDARDLNHDGKIDEIDIEMLTALCTYPNCATHP